jgi:hypothetical protein
MRIREREQREQGEGRPANKTTPAADPNPIVTLIVRLLGAAPVADDRVSFTYRASSQNLAVFIPVAFKLVQQDRKWDKKNRSPWGSAAGVDLPRSEPEAEPFSCEQSKRKRIKHSPCLQPFAFTSVI